MMWISNVFTSESLNGWRTWPTFRFRPSCRVGRAMQIVLSRKLAACLDGIDVSGVAEGDVLDLPRRDAELLVAEGWARPHRVQSRRLRRHSKPSLAAATDASARRARTLEHLHRASRQLDSHRFAQQDHRRAEDRIREEFHDACATTIPHGRRDSVRPNNRGSQHRGRFLVPR
jgi:hypothetical protein